jgi:translation initiation factor 6 (eIF-6)
MLAERLEYSISGDTKAALITSFLSAQSTDESADEAAADANADEEYTQAELETLTVYEINELATSLGYTITGSTKAALITSFLEAQTAQQAEDIAGADADSSGDYDAEELAALTIAEIKKLAA